MDEADYVGFANDLIVGRGPVIVDGWNALASDNPAAKREMATKLEEVSRTDLAAGPLKGLLFGDPRRFLTDLVMMLRLKAAFNEFVAAVDGDRDVKSSLQHFATAAEVWQKQHGYQCAWSWPKLADSLRRLKSPAIDAVVNEKGQGRTPFERVEDRLRITETYTPRLIAAMKKADQNIS